MTSLTFQREMESLEGKDEALGRLAPHPVRPGVGLEVAIVRWTNDRYELPRNGGKGVRFGVLGAKRR